jgi:hypothetical protein
MTAGPQRKAQRIVHLAAALVLLAYVYAPLEAQLQDAVRFFIFALLVMTGIAMWQAPPMRRALKPRMAGARSVGFALAACGEIARDVPARSRSMPWTDQTATISLDTLLRL